MTESMRAGAFRYQEQLAGGRFEPPIWYRGYAEYTEEAVQVRIPCAKVRRLRDQAIADAERLISKLKAT